MYRKLMDSSKTYALGRKLEITLGEGIRKIFRSITVDE
jgi:hypothetical protein